MATTSHLGITLLEQSQAQKEITINEALARIDAVLNSGVIDRDLATPPGSPATGDVYIVAASPTGDWSGKAKQVAYFDQIWRFIAPREGLLLWVNDENQHVVYDGANWQAVITAASDGNDFSTAVEGRLTLTSNIPVTTSDVTAATTVYFTPYKGNRIALYDGTTWKMLTFSQLSFTVPATTNTIYDVWAYISSGAVALDTTAWTNDTTRATALAFQDGVYIKSGTATRRYLGSFRTTGTSGRTEDSKAKRYVWNYYNRVIRLMSVIEPATWAYSTGAWRQANNNSANQLDFLQGVAEDVISALVAVPAINSTTTGRIVYVGIGFDSTTATYGRFASILTTSVGYQNMQALYDDLPSAGRHIITWLEYGGVTDTQTWAGADKFGIVGRLMG